MRLCPQGPRSKTFSYEVNTVSADATNSALALRYKGHNLMLASFFAHPDSLPAGAAGAEEEAMHVTDWDRTHTEPYRGPIHSFTIPH
jgi:hypothetical protein